MNIFLTHELTGSTKAVLYWADLADYMRSQQRGSQHFNEASYKLILDAVAKAQQFCGQAGFKSAFHKIGMIHQRLDLDRARSDSSYLAGELANVWDAILEAVVNTRFLQIAASRSVCVDNPNLMGPKVLAAFPKAKTDIIEAGNCLAAECNTAAVFHLMRAFEWGIRTFAADLGLTRFNDWSAKEQRFKYTPASFATWDKFIGQIPAKAANKLAGLRPGVKRQRRQEYYNSVYDDIKVVKDAWRNHVMHTRQDFKGIEAEAVFNRVKDMLERMADKP